MRLDGRVALLNTHVVQNFDPVRPDYQIPHQAARVIRVILTPVKLVKDFRYHIASQLSERPARPSPVEALRQIDLEVPESMEFASEKPYMKRFRKLLDRTYGAKIAECIMTEIDVLVM